MRYFIKLSYKGTNYHGWQIQPNAITVQEILQKALSVILREEIQVIGAGRTDTGVHAKLFFAHFDTGSNIDDTEKLVFKLNSFLPDDIAIFSVFKVNDELHARFSALSRTYEYHIHYRKDPFLNDYSHRLYHPPDIKLLNSASALLMNYSDFTSFSKLHTDTKTNICKIMKAEWTEYEDRLIFRITADRFLRNMVRAITGTVLDVGFGKLSSDEFKNITESKDRRNAGVSMPAKGLYLTDIQYPDLI